MLEEHIAFRLRLIAGWRWIAAGVVSGLAMTPATTAITDALPVAQQGVGSAMNDLARELGGALDCRARQRAAIDLPPPAAPDRATRAARRARSILPGPGLPVRSHQLHICLTGLFLRIH